MAKHVDLVAWFHIGLGALGLVGALFVVVFVTGAGFLSGDPDAMIVSSTLGVFVAAVIVITAIPAIVGGVGLLRRSEWGRILILVVAFFELFHVPLGTALAIYTFWALLQDETKWLFARSA